jgi:hypothetical protein
MASQNSPSFSVAYKINEGAVFKAANLRFAYPERKTEQRRHNTFSINYSKQLFVHCAMSLHLLDRLSIACYVKTFMCKARDIT